MKKNTIRRERKTQEVRNKPLFAAGSNTARYLQSAVHKFGDTLCLGYSPENWAKASDIIRDVDLLADQEIVVAFGDMISEAYTHLSYDRIEAGKKRILAMIESRTDSSL